MDDEKKVEMAIYDILTELPTPWDAMRTLFTITSAFWRVHAKPESRWNRQHYLDGCAVPFDIAEEERKRRVA